MEKRETLVEMLARHHNVCPVHTGTTLQQPGGVCAMCVMDEFIATESRITESPWVTRARNNDLPVKEYVH